MQIDRRPPLTMKDVEARRVVVRQHMCDLMKSSLAAQNLTIRTSGSIRSLIGRDTLPVNSLSCVEGCPALGTCGHIQPPCLHSPNQ